MNNIMSNEYFEKKIKEIQEEMIMKNSFQKTLHPDILALKHNQETLNNQIHINLNFQTNNQF